MKVEKSSTIPSSREAGQLEGGESAAEPSNVPPSLVSDSAPKDTCNTGTGGNSDSQLNQTTCLHQEMEERTTGPKETGAERLGQEGDVKEAGGGGVHSSSEQQTVCVASDVTKAEHTENADSVRTLCGIVDQNTRPSTSHFKPIEQNAESVSSVHSDSEENGSGSEENRDGTQIVAHNGTVSDGTSKPVSPLPQVNGKDGLGSESTLSNSVTNLNNGVLTDRPKVNSIGKVEAQKHSVSLKDSTQQKPLVNGDLSPVNRGVIKEKDPRLDSEVEERVAMSTQDYKPPLKLTRLENNMVGATTLSPLQNNSSSAFNAGETKPTPAVRIIRMAPSPIPSAEESSLSDDFAEENSNSGSTEQFKTIMTQVTTTSTTTTTVVSTEMKVQQKASGEVKYPVVTTESSAVSTLSTMTKTTVTKISSSGLDSQSEDSQSEVVMQDETRTQSACVYESTTGSGGTTTMCSVVLSQEGSSSTKGRVRLLKFSRTKKTRSDTALPSYRKFVTTSSRRSIFVLPHDDVKVLARRGGFREVPVFSYNAKPAQDIWPYPSPRPTFGITWR